MIDLSFLSRASRFNVFFPGQRYVSVSIPKVDAPVDFWRNMNSLHLDAKKTALVLIDLQNGIVAMPTAPYTAS